MLDSKPRGCGAGLSLADVTVLCPGVIYINHCLVLDQPRKTRPDITENDDDDEIVFNDASTLLGH